jgi:F1F0 ATPase subunit 2
MSGNVASFLTLGFYFVAGCISGTLYFRCLWWDVRRFAAGGRPGMTIFLMIGRIALLGGALTLASRAGALPLLLMALGVFIARFAVMRTLRERLP